jgi:hypothetical protein
LGGEFVSVGSAFPMLAGYFFEQAIKKNGASTARQAG